MDSSLLGHYSLLLLHHLGYGGLFLVLTLNAMGIPLPSEVLLPVTGLGVRQGVYQAVPAVVVAVVAQVLGAGLSYWIGRKGGRPLIARYGKYVLLSEADLNWASRWFERYGKAGVVVGYCLPLIRGVVGYAAGLGQMSARALLACAALGSLIWTIVMVSLGYRLANDLPAIERVMRPFSLIIAVVVVIGLVFAIYHRLKDRPA